MDTNRAVQDLYEQFPYPKPDTDLASIVEGKRGPAWNPKTSHAIFFPDQTMRQDLEILVAGCGTNTAQQHAAFLPKAKVTGIDISEASLALARESASRFGLKNLELIRHPIEKVADLGKTFDLVVCQGVLHHLEDPVVGLRALGSVTKPTGAMSLMVYGRYGRTGIYMLQELFRDRLGMKVCRPDLERLQAAFTLLPDDHPFRIVHKERAQLISLEEIADMTLHPRDKAYTVEDVRALVDGAGLAFQRWLPQVHYDIEVSPLAGVLGQPFAKLDPWQRAAAMELFHGTLLKHEFVVTPRGRPSPEDLFGGERIKDAVPMLSGHLVAQQQGEHVVLTNDQHQIPYRIHVPIRGEFAFLKRIDGKHTVAEIVAAGAKDQGCKTTLEEGLTFFRVAYRADMIDLRLKV